MGINPKYSETPLTQILFKIQKPQYHKQYAPCIDFVCLKHSLITQNSDTTNWTLWLHSATTTSFMFQMGRLEQLSG